MWGKQAGQIIQIKARKWPQLKAHCFLIARRSSGAQIHDRANPLWGQRGWPVGWAWPWSMCVSVCDLSGREAHFLTPPFFATSGGRWDLSPLIKIKPICPPQWKRGVLTTRPTGKSKVACFWPNTVFQQMEASWVTSQYRSWGLGCTGVQRGLRIATVVLPSWMQSSI